MKNINQNRTVVIIILIFLCSNSNLVTFARGWDRDDWDQIVNLKGNWKFAIGDSEDWASPSFNDEEWETIRVPSKWEDEGFYGYNGFAWYRTDFEIDIIYEDENLFLNLGYIDDVDEVYINGVLVGSSGAFPPKYLTAYSANRIYPIPKNILRFNAKNIIAVRVYDSSLAGGIKSGDIGISRSSNSMSYEVDFTGNWKFKIGDNLDWKNINANLDQWKDIMVPGYWSHYGYPDYDGFAWYRKEFYFDGNTDENYVLVLGKIDDIDEVFLNEKLVGSTGDFEDLYGINKEYTKLRVYYLSNNDLKENGNNFIAVRVYDEMEEGGIYEGPVGIMKLKTFRNYWKKKKRKKSFWDYIFNN